MKTSLLRRGIALLACLLSTLSAHAVDPPAGFALIGHIERFTLQNPGLDTSAATMRVRGVDVLLPANLIITMPGGYLTAQQLFKGRDLRQTVVDPQRSGLALVDQRAADVACPARPEFAGRQCPLPPAEVEVAGNVIDGRYVAGIVRISQGGLHIGNGFIRRIDADGTLWVGSEQSVDPANPLAGAARVRLNDPEGIFGVRSTGQDARFAIDPGYSSVHARTGFPVCVQRSAADPLCPSVNRPAPAATNYRRFTCGTVPVDNTAPVHAGCRPHLPVPLRTGDFINYAGRIDKDAQGYFFSLHGLDAELGVYTSPGVDPAYVFVEVALQGTVGERYADIPQEETSRFKLVAFATDPSRTANVELFDDNVNSGPLNPVLEPSRLATRIVPTNGAQLGRIRMLWAAKDDARIVRRAVRVTLSPATVQGNPNMAPGKSSLGLALAGASRRGGYAFGSYEAPVSEFISPELTRFGVKGYPLPVNFENFCFLKRTNLIETLAPDPTDATKWAKVSAGPLAPTPAARTRSQAGAGGLRVCND